MGRWVKWFSSRTRQGQSRFGGASGSGGAGGGASIQIDDSSIPEDAAIGVLVGILSVVGGSGTYVFTLTVSAGGLFALDLVDNTRLEVAGALDFETASSHLITVEANNGVDPIITRNITITVTDVAEGGAAVDVEALLLTGYYGWA